MKTLKERCEESYREYQERTLGEACPCYCDGYNTGAEEFRRMVLEELQKQCDHWLDEQLKAEERCDSRGAIHSLAARHDSLMYTIGEIKRLGLEGEDEMVSS